jgi:hypothetical protein
VVAPTSDVWGSRAHRGASGWQRRVDAKAVPAVDAVGARDDWHPVEVRIDPDLTFQIIDGIE